MDFYICLIIFEHFLQFEHILVEFHNFFRLFECQFVNGIGGFIATVVVSPISEELIFRGVLFNKIKIDCSNSHFYIDCLIADLRHAQLWKYNSAVYFCILHVHFIYKNRQYPSSNFCTFFE